MRELLVDVRSTAGCWAEMLRPLRSGPGEIWRGTMLGGRAVFLGCWMELRRGLLSWFSLTSLLGLGSGIGLLLWVSAWVTGCCFVRVARFASGEGGIGAMIWGCSGSDMNESGIWVWRNGPDSGSSLGLGLAGNSGRHGLLSGNTLFLMSVFVGSGES